MLMAVLSDGNINIFITGRTVPSDVLIHIFGFVDPPDLLSLARVSKHLNK